MTCPKIVMILKFVVFRLQTSPSLEVLQLIYCIDAKRILLIGVSTVATTNTPITFADNSRILSSFPLCKQSPVENSNPQVAKQYTKVLRPGFQAHNGTAHNSCKGCQQAITRLQSMQT